MSKRCKQKERNCSDTDRKKRPRPGRQFIVPSTCSSTRPAEVRQSCVNRPNDPPTEDGESNYSMLRLPRVGLSPPLGGMCDGDLKNTSQEKIPLWFGTFVQLHTSRTDWHPHLCGDKTAHHDRGPLPTPSKRPVAVRGRAESHSVRLPASRECSPCTSTSELPPLRIFATC